MSWADNHVMTGRVQGAALCRLVGSATGASLSLPVLHQHNHTRIALSVPFVIITALVATTGGTELITATRFASLWPVASSCSVAALALSPSFPLCPSLFFSSCDWPFCDLVPGASLALGITEFFTSTPLREYARVGLAPRSVCTVFSGLLRCSPGHIQHSARSFATQKKKAIELRLRQ